MRRVLLVLGVLLVASGANAQWRRYGDEGDYGRRRERRTSAVRLDVIERALRHVDSARPYRGGDRHWREVEKARKDLIRFQENWYRGRFDNDRLDGAIEHIEHIVRSSAFDSRDRRMLERDMWDLRAFRQSRGNPGVYDRGWRRVPGW